MKIKMEIQPSETKDVVWFFPVVGEGFITDAHKAISLCMVFYKTYEQAYVTTLVNDYKFVETVQEMLIYSHEFTLESLHLAMVIYKEEVAFRGKFDYLLLGNRFLIKVKDFMQYSERNEINKFEATLIRGV